MLSSRASAAPITRTRSTNGCLVCRLRGKKCIRDVAGDTCSKCSRLRLACHAHIGSIPSSMRDHSACQEACEEIREATNTAKSRPSYHPLPATGVFAELLKNAALNRGNVPAESQWRRSQGQVVLNDDAGHLTSSLNSSGMMDSFPAETLYPTPRVPYVPNPPSASHLSLAPHLYVPVGLPEDAPDQVVYPLQSPVSTNTINYRMPGPGADPHPSRPPLPMPPYHYQAAPDLEAIIENLKPLLQWCGYDIVRRRSSY